MCPNHIQVADAAHRGCDERLSNDCKRGDTENATPRLYTPLQAGASPADPGIHNIKFSRIFGA